MKLFTKTAITMFVVLFTSAMIFAQDAPEMKISLGGTVQAMVGMGQTGADTNQVGFGMRRTRLVAKVGFGKHFTGFIQYSAKSNKLLDARMTFKLNKGFNVRVGRFKIAGVRAGGLTSATKIDLVERTLTAQEWSKATIGTDYRDYGVEFLGKFNDFGYNLAVHNGHGSINITESQKTQAILLNEGVAISGMVNFKPKAVNGLEVGAYYGIGNANFNDYSSYSTYVYWEPKPIRVKADFVGWTNQNGPVDISSNGFSVLGAYGFAKNFEALVRFEAYDRNTDFDNDARSLITVGARYFLYPSKWTASKITAAYVINGEEGTAIDNDVFYVMFQMSF